MSGHPDSLPDEALAKLARAGDRAAFDVLCDRYLPVVYNRLRARLPLEAVDDVTQEVFVAAVRGIRRYQGQSSFRTWIAAISRHKVADYYRGRSRRPETTTFDEELNSPAVRADLEECVLVRVALQRLPAHYQEVLLLRFAEGLPFEQVAGALGISPEATKSRYRRAVAAIAREMDA